MLTTRTNRTLSATFARLNLGARSLAPVADVNMRRDQDPRGRHVSHLHFGRYPFAGMFAGFIDADAIRPDGPEIPGSPPVVAIRPGLGQPIATGPWSRPPVRSGRPEVGCGVVVRHVRRVEPAAVAVCPAATDLAAAGFLAARDRVSAESTAEKKRLAVSTGG